MTDTFRDVTVLSRGGLFTNEDALSLANSNPGAALRLLNFEISQFGGYRRVGGFAPYDSSYTTVTGSGRVLGLWIHNNDIYAARRNTGDGTGTLGSDPFTTVNESKTVTVAHTGHGLAVGSFVTFASATAVGGLTMNGTEYTVATVATNSYTFTHGSAATSGATGGGSSTTYSYSYNYSVYKYTAGVGWGSNLLATTRSAINVNKLRTSKHSFTGSEITVVTDGIGRPFRHSGSTFIDLYDRQGTSATDTEAQLSNAFDSANGDATVTVDHTAHGLAVGDTVRFSGVNVNIGGVSINNSDYTVATVTDANIYTFELGSASSAGSQTNVGGTAINFFYSYAATKDLVGAKFTTDFRNHQFFAGMSTNPNFLVFSNPSNDVNFQVSGGGGIINVGFVITGLAKFRDNLFVFGKDKIKRLSGNTTSDFVLQEVTNNIGCIAADSIIELGGDVLFLASDGIRPIQGTARIGDVELETISKPIQQILQALPSNHDLDNMCSVVIRNKTQFRYFFPAEATVAADTEGIIGGLRFADRRIGWEFGQLLGIRAFVSTSGLINNQEVVLHGDLDGKVHRQDSGNDFNGAEVISIYATPFLYFDSTEKRKSFQHLAMFTRPEGQSTINLGIAYDWDDPNVSTPDTYPLTTAGALLRYTTTGGKYDSTFTFGGSSSPVLETNIQGSGRAISLVITSTGTQAPYSISGFSVTYQEYGYR
jgi:hypothetical protein